jgi:hypothetical protein
MSLTIRKCLALVLVALALCFTATAPAQAQSVSVLVDGQILTFDQPPIMQGGRVLVPLRGIFERLGADVVYNPADRTIRATRGSTAVQLTLGSNYALVDGRSVYLDSPAQSFGGRTVVPLRFISEALGANVTWSAASKTVSIASSTTTPPIGTVPPPIPPPVATRPTIDTIIHNGLTTLRPGDSLNVIMTGTPGGSASFDLMGIVNNVSMREVSPGRYEGNLSISSNMRAASTNLVVHLNKNGLDTLQEASRPVTIALDMQQGGILTGNTQFLPANGSLTGVTRPTIYASFNTQIRPGTARIIVDGQDVTNLSSVGPNDILFVPRNDLAIGQHYVRVTAQDNNGSMLQEQWTFVVPQGAVAGNVIQSVTISPNTQLNVGQTITVTMRGQAGGSASFDLPSRSGIFMQEVSPGTYLGTYTISSNADLNGRVMAHLRLPNGFVASMPSDRYLAQGGFFGGNNNALFITVTSPQAGQSVPDGTFNVTGQTQAYATVEVIATERRSLIPGIIDIPGRTITARGQADANGFFTIPLTVGDLASRSTVDMRVRAMDQYGNVSETVQFGVATAD